MIGQLRGRLADKRPNQILMDVGGVGYLVSVPLSTYAALGELHTEVTLLIHSHIREDAFALKILSGMSTEELIPAIRGNDLGRLTKIPGVGRKTAERMVVELKDKLETMAMTEQKHSAAAPAGVAPAVV